MFTTYNPKQKKEGEKGFGERLKRAERRGRLLEV